MVMLALLLFGLRPSEAVARVADSVVILYSQNVSGNMSMRCTATAFAIVADKTQFVTAAHCVTEAGPNGRLHVVNFPLYVSPDEEGAKSFVKVDVEKVGSPDEGYDFAVLTAVMPKPMPTISLGDDSVVPPSTQVVNVSAPSGLGKVCFFGYVALSKIDRPLVDESSHFNWTGYMILSLPAEGGSSGSAIISTESGKIIGILVGGSQKLTIAMPIARVFTKDKTVLLR